MNNLRCGFKIDEPSLEKARRCSASLVGVLVLSSIFVLFFVFVYRPYLIRFFLINYYTYFYLSILKRPFQLKFFYGN